MERVLKSLKISIPLTGAILTLLLLLVAHAQGTGTITGQVTNGSRNQEPVPGITVTLHIFDSQAVEKGSLSTTADETGKFTFENLDTSPDLIYVAVAELDGVAYRSQLASFLDGRTAITLPLEVYEATDSDDAIVVERAHFIIDFDPEHQALALTEMYFINNTGDKTFVGQEDASGKRLTLHIPLPEEARDVSAERIIIKEGEAIYTLPVLPGPIAEPIVLDYVLPVAGSKVQLSRKTNYPIKNYNFLVADVGLQVSAPGAEFRGKIGQGDKMYLNYAGANLEEGAELVLELSGLSRVRPPSGGGFSLSTLIAVTLAVLLLIIMLVFYPRWRSSAQPVSRASLRERLIQELADLDDAFEQGLIDEDEYTRKREAKKKQLMKLMRK